MRTTPKASSATRKYRNCFIALARQGSGKLNYGSTGVGSGPNLSFEMLKAATSINLEHVPYKGDALLQLAIVGQQQQPF